MLDWYSRWSRLTEFSAQVAAHLTRWYPPAVELARPMNVSERRVAEILTRAFEAATRSSDGYRPGLMARAILAMRFRARLRELGYSDRFVRDASEALVSYLTRGTLRSAAGSDRR